MQDSSVTFASLKIWYYKYKETYYYPLTIVAGIFIVSVILFVQLVVPQIASWFSLQKEISDTRERIKNMVNNDQFLISQGDTKISDQLGTTVLALPLDKDFNGIYNAIVTSSSEVGVSLSDFSFSVGDLSEQAPGGLANIQVSLAVSAPPEQVDAFVKALLKSVPLSQVTNWTSTGDTASLTIQFYYRAMPIIAVDKTIPLKPLSAAEVATLNTLRSWQPQVIENTTSPEVATDSSTTFPDPL